VTGDNEDSALIVKCAFSLTGFMPKTTAEYVYLVCDVHSRVSYSNVHTYTQLATIHINTTHLGHRVNEEKHISVNTTNILD